MKLAEVTLCSLKQIIMAMVFLLGFHGFGYSLNLHCTNSKDIVPTHRDSLIVEMVEFIQPDFKLTGEARKHIENRIKLFPPKVIRRDTISHFLNTAYAIAYYEFVRHDYKKAKKLSDHFREASMPPGFFSAFFSYRSVGLFASSSLTEKGKLKEKKDKNSWYVPIKFVGSDSVEFHWARSDLDFLNNFIDDVPLDCATSTYQKLLAAFHNGGGRLEWLNGYSCRGFIQRCVDSDRMDILDIIYDLWNVTYEDFYRNQLGYLIYQNPALNVDSIAIDRTSYVDLSFDINVNKHQIDSLISAGADVDLTPRIMYLADLCYSQSKFSELVDACERLSAKVAGSSLNIFHNYWGLGLSALGRYEESILHFDEAIKHSTDRQTISKMRLNKACSLGEMRRTQEAVEIFMQEKDMQSTPFDKFVWHDNLGYIFSYSDPSTALYYYEAAEKYLDSGGLYLDRKIRHFCRKAQVLTHNSYLQRCSIEKALEYTRVFGCSDVDKGMAYSEWAAFISSIFDYKEADRLYREAGKYYENLAESDLRKIRLSRNFALNLFSLGHKDKALQLLLRELKLTKQSYGNSHVEYAYLLCTLLQLACSYPLEEVDIDSLYQELSNLKSTNNQALFEFELRKSEIAYLVYSGRWNEALQASHNALRSTLNPTEKLGIIQQLEVIARKNLSQSDYVCQLCDIMPILKISMIGGLLTLSGGEDRALSKPLEEIIDGALAKGAHEEALKLCLFRKGLLFTKKKTIERKLAEKRPLKKLMKRLRYAREELNKAVAYNDSVHIPELSANVFKLERELGNKVSSEKRLHYELDRTLQQVTERLSDKDLAVEFVRYSYGNDLCYGAFLIDRNGLNEFRHIGTEKEVQSNPGMVWSWLPGYIDRYAHLYFCPDGIVNRVGIEYLSESESSHSSIKFHRVFHLSEIDRNSYAIGDRIVVVGVSDHNSPFNNGETVNRGNWTDLPNVDYEIEMITKNLDSSRLTLLLNDRATEPNVLRISGDGVSTLHFSTHGFYRSNEILSQAASDSSHEDHHITRRFLSGGLTEISGLVLRQGNISWRSPFILDEYDDLLTAEEVELLSFPNLNLTVLSACESGLGEIDSDGVWGLQRAFRIAGTKNLICTLTKVDDYWTAQFMDAFYEKAANGTNIYDSFQSARQWLRSELPDNPEIWSSFILIE